jgi:hypothetical protein
MFAAVFRTHLGRKARVWVHGAVVHCVAGELAERIAGRVALENACLERGHAGHGSRRGAVRLDAVLEGECCGMLVEP